jgi:hypothetical protein
MRLPDWLLSLFKRGNTSTTQKPPVLLSLERKSDVELLEYYFIRAIRFETTLKETNFLYFLSYVSIDKLNIEEINVIELVKGHDWSRLISIKDYNAQGDNVWIAGAKLNSDKYYVCIVFDSVELWENEYIAYYEELSEQNFMQIPFTEYKVI